MTTNLVLKAEIVKQGYNLTTFCAEIAMEESCFNRRINGKVPFKEDEIYLIANKLNKSADELFFTKDVAVLATQKKRV